jgi:hypothetical protein
MLIRTASSGGYENSHSCRVIAPQHVSERMHAAVVSRLVGHASVALRWRATFTARKTISTRRVSPPPGCAATFDLKVGHDWNTRWSPTLLIGVTD